MYHRIGFGKRAAAWLIDMVAIAIGGFFIGIVGGLFGLRNYPKTQIPLRCPDAVESSEPKQRTCKLD